VCLRVCLCVIEIPQQRGGLGWTWAVAPQREIRKIFRISLKLILWT
jgi:hypothetical protein